jgi:hypothetical protein
MAEPISQSQQVDTVFAKWFQHLPQYCIVVCVNCRTAVVPDHIAAHLQRNHKSVSKKEQQQAQSYVDGLENIARNIANVQFPRPEEPPCKEIPVYQDGLRCTWEDENGQECQYVVSTKRMMQTHCSKAHHWQNEQKRGGNMKQKSKHTPNRIWREGQAYQRFFQEPPWKRYTAVNTTAVNKQSTTTVSGREALAIRLANEMEAESVQQQQQRVIQGPGGRQETSPWLRFTA